MTGPPRSGWSSSGPQRPGPQSLGMGWRRGLPRGPQSKECRRGAGVGRWQHGRRQPGSTDAWARRRCAKACWHACKACVARRNRRRGRLRALIIRRKEEKKKYMTCGAPSFVPNFYRFYSERPLFDTNVFLYWLQML